jgi:hypothetical protein
MPSRYINASRSKVTGSRRIIGVVWPNGRVETSMRRGSIDLKIGPAILGGGFGYEINDGVMDVEMIAGNKTWLLLAKHLDEYRCRHLRQIVMMLYNRHSGMVIDSPDNPVVFAIGGPRTTIARTIKVADFGAAIERIKQFAAKPIKFRKPTFEQ